jgi:predicted nuclease of predicted toxin-antitoxin system
VNLLLDANLSPEVARILDEAGHDAIHVRDIGLLSAPDAEILRAAADRGDVLVTADSDFGTLLALGDLASPSVLLLRSADHLRPAEQASLILANLPRDRRRSCEWCGCEFDDEALARSCSSDRRLWYQAEEY